ncbi:13513_t:CDS:2 [Gigaspora margarita]|uniref:13513_t:CDS:1 n=1 Tax=Gigaspora margarita TaxID=4874 RepID=A0ABN7UQ32_GIGMA|nr:13513_t:CDS:2 [Gigaspora margarita]
MEDTKDTIDTKDTKDTMDTKDTKEPIDIKDTKESIDKKDTKDTRDIKFILSIDGGGFRGLIPAVILQEIEKRVTDEIKKDHPDVQDIDIRCADLFEIISGTSTGSILALGLSTANEKKRPRFDAQYIVDFYKEHGYDVFPDYSAVMSVDKLLPKLPTLISEDLINGNNKGMNEQEKSTITSGFQKMSFKIWGIIMGKKNTDTNESKKKGKINATRKFKKIIIIKKFMDNKKNTDTNESKAKEKKNTVRHFKKVVILQKFMNNKKKKEKVGETEIKSDIITRLKIKKKADKDSKNKPENIINATPEDTINATSEGTINTTSEVIIDDTLEDTINATSEHIRIDKSEDTIISEDTISEDIIDSKSDIVITQENHHAGIWEHLSGLVNTFNPWMPKYKPTGFEGLLEKSFKHSKLKDTVNDVTVIIPAYNISRNEYTLFTNYDPIYKDHYVRDVIRASAAAPTYFPAKQIGEHYFIDGGVFSNNPTVKAYLEAKRKYPNTKFVVVSLGTGYYKEHLETYKDCGVVQWIKPLINLLFNSELDNHHNTMKNLADLDGTSYYRIQLHLEEEDSNLDNVSDQEAKKLTDLAHKAIHDPVYKFEEIVNLLVDKCRKHNIVPTKRSRN